MISDGFITLIGLVASVVSIVMIVKYFTMCKKIDAMEEHLKNISNYARMEYNDRKSKEEAENNEQKEWFAIPMQYQIKISNLINCINSDS